MKRISEHRKRQLIYLLADIISAEVVWIMFLLFRWLVYEGWVFGVEEVLIPAFSFYRPLIIYPLACIGIYYLTGYYMRPGNKSLSREVLMTFVASIIIVLGAFFVIIIDDEVESYQRYYISLLVLFSLQFLVSLSPRLIISHWYNRYQEERVFVISEYTEHTLEALKEQMPVNRIHIELRDKRDIYKLIALLYPYKAQITLSASTFDILSGAAKIGDLEDQPQINITQHKMSDWQLAVKRASDIIVSLASIIILLPVYMIIAIVVWASSKGPAIYKQERIGMYGKPFYIYKFRTMFVDAESDVPRLTDINDERITHVGRILRKYRLDELPQFFNVLKGDMSIVGPRPEREYFIEKIMEEAPYYCLLYRIRPGLTSWGPIKVGYTDTLQKMIDRLNYDIAYMENMSISLDLKIMFYTLRVLFNGEGQ